MPRETMVCQRFTFVAAGRIQASTETEPAIRKSGVERVATVPWKPTGEVGATVGYAAALAAVPENVAEPLVPPKGDAPPNVTPVEPTATDRVVPDASVGVVPAVLLNRNHNTGESAVTAVPYASEFDGFGVTVTLFPEGAVANANGTPTATAPDPVPLGLIADTRKVVRVPLTSPVVPVVTTHAVIDVHVNPLTGFDTNGVVAVVVPRTEYVPPVEQFALQISTLYPEIAEPPVIDGAVHASDTEPVLAAVAESATGTPGAPPGVWLVTLPVPAPARVIALTRKKYTVPFVRPLTTSDVLDAGTLADTVVKPVVAAEVHAAALVVQKSTM